MTAHETITGADIAKLLLKYWGFPILGLNVSQVGGHNNDVRRVQTADGCVYFLRLKYWPTQRLANELAIISHTSRLLKNIQLPYPVKTLTDELYAVISEDHVPCLATMTPALRGTKIGPRTLATAKSAGDVLGQITHKLTNFILPEPYSQKQPYRDFIQSISSFDLISRAKQRLSLQSSDLNSIIQAIDAVKVNSEKLLKLPSQVIHSDFMAANLLFEQSAVSAVLDWEFSCCDIKLFDIAGLISTWVDELDDVENENLHIETILEGYESHQPLDRFTKDLIGPSILARELAIFDFFLMKHSDQIVMGQLRTIVAHAKRFAS